MSEYFGEDDYIEKMSSVVEPFLREHDRADYFTGVGGAKLHYHALINPDERAAIVISHGFCEFFGKYHEMAYYYYSSGYSVFFIEHRGHGLSHRETDDPEKVHCSNFDNYVEDLEAFMEQVVTKKSLTGRFLLFGHSMGGCIGGLFLERHPSYFQAAVLSSPMMELSYNNTPLFAVKALMLFARLAGWEERYAPGQHGFDGVNRFSDCSSQSKVRYDYYFNYRVNDPSCRTSGGTYGWVESSISAMESVIADAGKIRVPVLLIQAGCDEIVKPGGQERFAAGSLSVELVEYPKARHEIFNSLTDDRIAYYEQVIGFYEPYALPGAAKNN